MTDYTQNVSFGPKDSLTAGDPAKKIKGTEIDAEFAEISTAIASKQDASAKGASNGYASLGSDAKVPAAQLPTATDAAQGAVELATTTEAVTGSATDRAVTPAGLTAVLAQNGGLLQDLAGFSDPNADYILFWDDSAGQVNYLGAGSQMAISGTSLVCTVDLTNLNASYLSSGTIPDARVAASNVTQHQGSLSITEAQVQDGSTLARMGGNEAVTGAWTFSQVIKKASGGAYVHYDSATYAGGKITVSTSAASGSPTTAGDLWIQYTA